MNKSLNENFFTNSFFQSEILENFMKRKKFNFRIFFSLNFYFKNSLLWLKFAFLRIMREFKLKF